jgi:hypothetical protein
MYPYSVEIASSMDDVGLEERLRACDKRLDKTDDVSKGVGSSGFVVFVMKARKDLYGFGCCVRVVAKAGMSEGVSYDSNTV